LQLAEANIVLCGFMASGKTSVGKALGAITHRRLVDTDDLIVAEAGLSIPQIFERDGERAFRELERGIVSKIAKRKGLIIALGGGAVLDERNVADLRANGRVYWLKVAPEDVLDRAGRGDDRPLLPTDRDNLEKMMDCRENAYSNAADVVINASGMDVHEIAEQILLDFQRLDGGGGQGHGRC
jgi:shikimate kinase